LAPPQAASTEAIAMVVTVVRKRLGKERAAFLPVWELLGMLECRMSCFRRFVRGEGVPAADCFPPVSMPRGP
jgi:hypothetical protein